MGSHPRKRGEFFSFLTNFSYINIEKIIETKKKNKKKKEIIGYIGNNIIGKTKKGKKHRKAKVNLIKKKVRYRLNTLILIFLYY